MPPSWSEGESHKWEACGGMQLWPVGERARSEGVGRVPPRDATNRRRMVAGNGCLWRRGLSPPEGVRVAPPGGATVAYGSVGMSLFKDVGG